MKIALIGYGKMGKAIEQIALERGHDIVLRIGIENLQDFTFDNIRKADVAIEFTSPEAAFENIKTCILAGINIVSGSTGWVHNLESAKQLAIEKSIGFIYASNFSLGVNLFFGLNEYLARLMAPHKAYNVWISETHHTAKKDAPSGTAITLAEQLLKNHHTKNAISLTNPEDDERLYIESKRIDPAPGTHVVQYHSDLDSIKIEHEAHSRTGFAMGAVVAAEYILGKAGVFTMKDVLNL